MIRAGVSSAVYRQEWTRDFLREDLQENPYFQAHRGHRDQIIDALLAMAAEADSLPDPAVSAPRLTPDSLRNLSREAVAESATRRAGIVPSADCVQAMIRAGVMSVAYRQEWTRDVLREDLQENPYFQTNPGHRDQIIEALVAMAAEADSSPDHSLAYSPTSPAYCPTSPAYNPTFSADGVTPSGGAVSAVSMPQQLCIHLARCTDGNCLYHHVSPAANFVPPPGKLKRANCRFGAKCAIPTCLFDHPSPITHKKGEVGGSVGNPAVSAEEKERIVAMIGDLDEKYQSKIYEIIEKYQPKLLMGSAECDIEVRLLIRRYHVLLFTLPHARLF
jgi:hypothetical protein